MENKNELTVTFNISDNLLNAIANILLISSGPPTLPSGLPPQLLAALQGGHPTPERIPIGFAPKGKTNEGG